MMRITNVDVVRIDRIERAVDVVVDGGIIRSIGRDGHPAADGAVIDGAGKFLVPGFIDLHFHGAGRFQVDAGPAELAELCRLLPRYGVTGFLPTVIPRPPEPHRALLASLAGGAYEGARILGFFLEGPFLKLTGALPADALAGLSPRRIEELKAAVDPYPAVFAAAPDVESASELIPLMAANERTRTGRVPVFMTHTAASVEQTRAGIEAGITHATHFYDVFPSPPETDPGVRPCGAVEAVLADPRLTVDFILDGEHVDPVAVRMALCAKGAGGVCLVTDANVGAGLPPGVYRGVGGEVEFAYEGAPARMTAGTAGTQARGCLAGSGLTMDRAVRNAPAMVGVDLVQAVRMAGANPASVLGLEAETGTIDVGKRADLVLLDAELGVLRTWVNGVAVYERESAGVAVRLRRAGR